MSLAAEMWNLQQINSLAEFNCPLTDDSSDKQVINKTFFVFHQMLQLHQVSLKTDENKIKSSINNLFNEQVVR